MEVCPQQDVSAGLVKPEARAPGGGNKNKEQLEEKNLVREDVMMKKPQVAPPAAAASSAKKSLLRPPVLKSARVGKKLAAKKSWLAGKKHTSEKKQQYQKRSKTFQDFRKEHKGKFSEAPPAVFDGPGKKPSEATTPFLTKQKQTAIEMRDRRKVQKKKYDAVSSKFKEWRASQTKDLSGKTEKEVVKMIYEVGKPVAVQN